MFGSENIHVVTLVIDADPGGTGEMFYLCKVPRAATVLNAYMVSEQTQNAGTAVVLRLEDWGTAGTAVAGTITSLGGTAAASVLTARVPATATISQTLNYLDAGTWLVVDYVEQGTGWIAGDRFTFTVHLAMGKDSTSE